MIASQELAGLDMRPQLEIDAQVKFHELGGATYQLIQQMAPFGQGNPAPLFLSRAVSVNDCRPMGASGQHLKLRLKQNNVLWEAVAFGLGERGVEDSVPLDIVYHLEQDDWNGNSRLRLNIQDSRAHGHEHLAVASLQLSVYTMGLPLTGTDSMLRRNA
jgi:single-stranded-DNA-specific exonuclease